LVTPLLVLLLQRAEERERVVFGPLFSLFLRSFCLSLCARVRETYSFGKRYPGPTTPAEKKKKKKKKKKEKTH